MPPLTTEPLTTTRPCRSRSSNRSLAGSQVTVKTVPLTVTRNGPASTNHRCPRLCVMSREAVPCSTERWAPSVLTERRRPRVPGINANRLPSLKNTFTPAEPDWDKISALEPGASLDPGDGHGRLGREGRLAGNRPDLQGHHDTDRGRGTEQREATKDASLPRTGGQPCADRAQSLIELRDRVRLGGVAPQSP